MFKGRNWKTQPGRNSRTDSGPWDSLQATWVPTACGRPCSSHGSNCRPRQTGLVAPVIYPTLRTYGEAVLVGARVWLAPRKAAHRRM
jgi:hypothetical protein